jgi:hypothetical protein
MRDAVPDIKQGLFFVQLIVTLNIPLLLIEAQCMPIDNIYPRTIAPNIGITVFSSLFMYTGT